MRQISLFLVIFAFLLTSCNLSQSAPTPEGQNVNDLMETVVAATLQAMTPQASPPAETSAAPTPSITDTPAATPTPSTAKVSGKVCYHDAAMLDLTIYFQNTADDKLWTQSVSRPQEDYSVELPPGKYKVYAWPPDYTVGVLVKDRPTVDVALGQDVTGLDLCDYSQGPFAAPYPPGVSPSDAQGSISGVISGYGGGNNASFTVVAFNQGTGYWYYLKLLAGQTDYSIPDLPAGRYQVVVYDGKGVTAGTQPNVYVVAGKDTTANIDQWGGGYPPNPAP